MDDTETILWLSRTLAAAKKNEARLTGEVLKGNAAIEQAAKRIEALEAEVAKLREPRGTVLEEADPMPR